MSDSDSEISIDENHVMERIKKPLFRPVRPVRASDANTTDCIEWAITVNIQPTKKMNSRQWKKYDAAEQIKILGRIEARLRKDNPSIVLKEIHYETCPTLKQIHFHALYEMPQIFLTTLETYYNRVCGSTGNQTNPWRHLDITAIRSREAWIHYIRKDQNK